MNPKPYQIRAAKKWLRYYEEQRKGLRDYVSPGLYTEGYCKEILARAGEEERYEQDLQVDH